MIVAPFLGVAWATALTLLLPTTLLSLLRWWECHQDLATEGTPGEVGENALRRDHAAPQGNRQGSVAQLRSMRER
jgi:hypothetical protein